MPLIPHDIHLHIGYLLFEGVDQIDLTGPFEALSRIPNATVEVRRPRRPRYWTKRGDPAGHQGAAGADGAASGCPPHPLCFQKMSVRSYLRRVPQ